MGTITNSREIGQEFVAAKCGDQHAASVRSSNMNATIIRSGRVIDPANKRNEIADVYIADGKIVPCKSEIRNAKSETNLKSESPKFKTVLNLREA